MKNTQSKITKAVIYPKGCTITRLKELTIEQGEAVINIGPIKAPIDKDSIHVTGKSKQPGMVIRGVEIKEKLSESTYPQEEKNKLIEEKKVIEEKIVTVQDQLNYINKHSEVYSVLEENLGKDFSLEYARGRTDGIRLKDIMDLLEKRESDLYPKLRKLERELEDHNNSLEIIDDELRKFDYSSRPTTKIFVEVTLFLEAKSEVKLEISYNSPRGSWYPLYDLRLKDEGRLELEYYGLVSQSTTEDWDDIDISLSTALPRKVSNIPKLSTQWLTRPRPPSPVPIRGRAMVGGAPPKAKRAVPASATKDKMMFRAVAEAQVVEHSASVEQAQIGKSEIGEAIIFEVPKKQSIPSGKDPKKILTTQIAMNFSQFYKTVPKISTDVYNIAKISSELILLPGKIRIFAGNDFVGTTTITKKAPNEEFEVCLGVVDTIKVKRKLVNKNIEKKGTIGKTTRELFDYEINIDNLREEESRILIEDQYPKSNLTDVKSELLEVTNEPEISGLNVLKWDLILRARKTKKLIVSYKVSYPPGERPVGLD